MNQTEQLNVMADGLLLTVLGAPVLTYATYQSLWISIGWTAYVGACCLSIWLSVTAAAEAC